MKPRGLSEPNGQDQPQIKSGKERAVYNNSQDFIPFMDAINKHEQTVKEQVGVGIEVMIRPVLCFGHVEFKAQVDMSRKQVCNPKQRSRIETEIWEWAGNNKTDEISHGKVSSEN